MGKLLRNLFGKAFAWLTGKFLGEVAVSAVVTFMMAGMFSHPTSNAEQQVPPPKPPLLTAAMAFDPKTHWLDLPIDFGTTASLPENLTLPTRSHRVTAAKPQTMTLGDDVPLPPRRPVLIAAAVPPPLAQAKLTAPRSAPPSTSTCADATGDEAPCPPGLIPDGRPAAEAPQPYLANGLEAPVPEDRRYVFFGMVPDDLLPLPRRRILIGASIRQTIAGLASHF